MIPFIGLTKKILSQAFKTLEVSSGESRKERLHLSLQREEGLPFVQCKENVNSGAVLV